MSRVHTTQSSASPKGPSSTAQTRFPCSVPPRKLALRGRMTHTKHESYMTHLQDLVVFLLNNQAESSTKMKSPYKLWSVENLFIFCHSTWHWQPQKKTPDPQTASLGEQSCIENLKVRRLVLPRPMSRFVILFNYRVFTFHIMSTLM